MLNLLDKNYTKNIALFLIFVNQFCVPLKESFSLRSFNLHAQFSEGDHDFVDINYTCNTNQYPQLGLLYNQ